MDDLDQDLATLAPKVDSSAARELFDARRGKLRRRRRAVNGIAAVLAAAGVVGGISALARDGEETVEVGDGPPGPVEFQVLDVLPLLGFPYDQTPASLVADGDRLGSLIGEEAAAEVDLESHIVVAITTTYDNCEVLAGFGRQGNVLLPDFEVPDPDRCSRPEGYRPATFVVAIDRTSLGDADRLGPPDDWQGVPEDEYLRLPSPLDFEVLVVDGATEPTRTLRVATDDAELDALWQGTGMAGATPEVDFGASVVVSFTIDSSACSAPLAGFQFEDGTLLPVFAGPLACTAGPSIERTFVVAIDRATVEPGFVLWLPGYPPHLPEQRLEVELDDESPSPSVIGSEPVVDEVTFEVLGSGEAVESMGTLRAAGVASAYVELWARSGLDGDPRPVELAEQVVVSITIPDDACPPELEAFELDGDTITPLFVEPDGGCILPLISRTYVVALDRDSIQPGVTLLLPGDARLGLADQLLVVPAVVPPQPPEWFADREELPSCGTEVEYYSPGYPDYDARSCFQDAYRSGRPAELTRLTYGDEGEHALTHFRITGADSYEVVLEQREPDAANATGWQRWQCTSFAFIDSPGSEGDGAPYLNFDGECTVAEDAMGSGG